jgi:hypothetical protein
LLEETEGRKSLHGDHIIIIITTTTTTIIIIIIIQAHRRSIASRVEMSSTPYSVA